MWLDKILKTCKDKHEHVLVIIYTQIMDFPLL